LLVSSVRVRLAVVCIIALTAAAGGCSNRAQLFEDSNGGGFFSKPIDYFTKPEWAQTASPVSAELGPRGPVAADELVNADGSCAPKAAEISGTATASPPASPAANPTPDGAESNDNGSVAAVPASLPTGTESAPVSGGIALGMSECEAVRRAGTPSHVVIGTADQGERSAVLTYSGGSWPGIYTFNGGRLKVVDAVPEPEKPKVVAKAKTNKASQGAKRVQRTKNVAQQEVSHVSIQ
jgi:hypothetical protein